MMNLPVTVLAGGAWLSDTAFTNLGTVAFVLMIVCSLLGIVYFIRQLAAPKDEPEESAAPLPYPMPQYAPLSAPVSAEKPAKKGKSKSAPAPAPVPAVDNGALVAVLTAAVAAVLADEAAANGTAVPSFRVVSFQRSSRGRSWNGHR